MKRCMNCNKLLAQNDRDVCLECLAETIKEDNVRWFIDPASSGSHIQREGNLYTLFDEYMDNGIVCEKAEKDVDMGINRVGEYFKSNKIKIFANCKNLINELERYHWSEEKETSSGVLKPKPFKKEDHLADCIKYLVASRFEKSELKYTPEINPESAWGRMLELRKKKKEYVH